MQRFASPQHLHNYSCIMPVLCRALGAATTKHTMTGQKILRGDKRALFWGGKHILNIIKQITIQKTSGGQDCCQGAFAPCLPL